MTNFTSRPKRSIGREVGEKYFLSLSGIKFLFSVSPTHSPLWQKKKTSQSTFLSSVPPDIRKSVAVFETSQDMPACPSKVLRRIWVWRIGGMIKTGKTDGGTIPSLCHSAHHIFHMDWPGIVTGPWMSRPGEQQPEPARRVWQPTESLTECPFRTEKAEYNQNRVSRVEVV